jgi:hypothetical protein
MMLFSPTIFGRNLTTGVIFPITSNFLAYFKVRIYWVSSENLEMPGAATAVALVPAWYSPPA